MAPVRSAPQLAADIAADADDRLILLTGPSCAGKSTLATALARAVAGQGRTAAIVSVDDHLNPTTRGTTTYLADQDTILTPADYDWPRLWRTVDELLAGQEVESIVYRRGAGWMSATRRPADLFLVEGLFLDSTEADRHQAVQRIGLTAPSPALRRRRLARDAELRRVNPGWRSEAESNTEFERTLRSYECYERSRRYPWTWFQLAEVSAQR